MKKIKTNRASRNMRWGRCCRITACERRQGREGRELLRGFEAGRRADTARNGRIAAERKTESCMTEQQEKVEEAIKGNLVMEEEEEQGNHGGTEQ